MDYWVALVATVAIVVIFLRYIKFTKDVPLLYLSEQSIVEDTSKSGESTIHKSNKLDFSRLRVGLDIRYDSYKLRNGNLTDIYEFFMKNPEQNIVINGETRSVYNINFLVDQIVKYIENNNIESICFKNDDFMKDFFGFTLILAGFISQTTIIIYDYRKFECPKNSINFNKFDFTSHFQLDGQLSTFENVYSPAKDKGIAIKLVKQIHQNLISTVQFTQLNIISAIASNIKHLPELNQWNSSDTLLVTQSAKLPLEEVSNSLIKILSTFITKSNLIVTCDFRLDHLTRYNPTILFIDPQVASVLTNPTKYLSSFQKILKKYSLLHFKLGKLPKFKPFSTNLRLIYITKNIQSPNFEVSDLRACFGTRIITESCHYRVIGPIILTDFYDYRDFKIKFDSFGCIYQSLEIKLGDFNNNKGYLMLRGYNIGKNTFELNGVVEENKNCQNDGFLPLDDIRGSWGTDGCLYIGT